MGVRHPPQQVQNRQAHRGQDAVQNAENQHRSGGRHSEHELAAPELRQPPVLRDVDHLHRGVDHQRPKRRGRKVLQHTAAQHRRRQHQNDDDERVHLRFPARRAGHHGA